MVIVSNLKAELIILDSMRDGDFRKRYNKSPKIFGTMFVCEG